MKCVCLRYMTWCFTYLYLYKHIDTHFEIISQIKLINISITSHSYHFFLFCGENTSKFQLHNKVLLIVFPMLYISSLEIIHHRDNEAVQWGKELSFQQLVLRKLDVCIEKKRICIPLRIYIKINSKRVADSNWWKVNVLGEKTGEYLHDCGTGKRKKL